MTPRLVLPPDSAAYGWEAESKGMLLGAEAELAGQRVEITFDGPTRLAHDVEGCVTTGRVVVIRRLVVVEVLTIDLSFFDLARLR